MVTVGILTAILALIFLNSDTPNPIVTPTLAPLIVGQLPTETHTPTLTPTPSTTPLPPSPTIMATNVHLQPTDTPSLNMTAPPQATTPTSTTEAPSTSSGNNITASPECPIPNGWVAHQVQAGETLFAYQLGTNNTITVDEIINGNCLAERWVYEGQQIYLPVGAAENAPSSDIAPTAIPVDPNAPPPPTGLTRSPQCPCELNIPQGYRLEQIAELIDSVPVGFRGADFLTAARLGTTFAAGRPLFEGAPPNATLEGYIFPTTYTITNEMDANGFIQLALDTFEANTNNFIGDAAARGLTAYDLVTLASIVNRESRSPNQQVLIASVFLNRLANDQGLGATVTTQYALGQAGNWWPNVNGRVSTTDSPYNTNIYQGLPPSPIASPSLDALRSTVYPADTNYFYFTGNCRGSGNVYAETYEQHLANVRCE